jgi:hypothetical protein
MSIFSPQNIFNWIYVRTVFVRHFEIFTEGYGHIYDTGRMGSNDQVLTANKVR